MIGFQGLQTPAAMCPIESGGLRNHKAFSRRFRRVLPGILKSHLTFAGNPLIVNRMLAVAATRSQALEGSPVRRLPHWPPTWVPPVSTPAVCRAGTLWASVQLLATHVQR